VRCHSFDHVLQPPTTGHCNLERLMAHCFLDASAQNLEHKARRSMGAVVDVGASHMGDEDVETVRER
jgi:hypothetical protein